MERDNLQKYNIINNYDREGIMGFYKDIIRYNKAICKEYIDKSIDYENVKDILDLTEDLEKNYDNGVLGDDDLLEITYHQMGAYCWCKWEREEEK